jgi:hypothetical protein
MAGSLLATVLVGPVAASTASTTLNFSGSATVQTTPTFGLICDDCAPDVAFGGDNVGLGARVTLSAVASWHPSARVDYQYSPSLLRQGQTLDLVDTLTGLPGPLSVTYHVAGDYGIYFNTTFPADGSQHGSDFSTFDFSTSGSGSCTLQLDGDGSYDCQTVKDIPIFSGDLFGLFGAAISVPVTTTINITPDGVATVRTISAGGSTVQGPDALHFHGPTPSVVADPFTVSCTAPAGTNALYDLASTESNPTLVASTDVSVKVTITIIIDFGGTAHVATFGPGSPTAMHLTAPSNQIDLGPILANNIPPNTVAGGPYSGDEGQAIQFDGSGTTSVCPIGLTYVWNFSDGGVAFGKSPFHTFQGPGTYSGQLTVTDVVGNHSAQAFSVTVGNLAPVVNAGPDTTAAWGRQVAFNGSAVDPGANDQPGLSYRWSFGDGTPSATGGPSVSHAYSTPGDYLATFTSCDQWGLCSDSARTVHVRMRHTTVGYLGDHSGTYATSAAFSASLVDEFNQAVSGRAVALTVGPEAQGSPMTNSSGLASASHVLHLGAGSYTAAANFAGDSLYDSAGPSTTAFTVGQKATSITYTGSLTGGPNKVITLSAKLVDATGTALAGKTVQFQLGSQSGSAVTDASGVAATTLKLIQKNGSYTVTASYAPSGGDTSLYLGSGNSATFKLQAK